MIHELTLKGYRGFADYKVPGLARVNLLLGTNNSGKTSVLEAVRLLCGSGDPSAIWQALAQRGERWFPDEPDRYVSRTAAEADICHLFLGHEMELGTTFRIESKNSIGERWISYTVVEKTKHDAADHAPKRDPSDEPLFGRFSIAVGGDPAPPVKTFRLTARGGLSADEIMRDIHARRRTTDLGNVQFLSTDFVSADYVLSNWAKIALRPEEDRIVKALQILQPDLEAFRVVGGERYPGSRGGVIVKCKRSELPVPIGSMGEGMWRILCLAMAVIRAQNGVLLVDEIDTGFHYTVMTQMWEMIIGASTQFDVQVFATTHSYDCVSSLAAACTKSASLCAHANQVSIQRIERGTQAVAFTEAEFVSAAQHRIEIR
ncbi:MAG: AAA family ATPase [Planctomycetota bacterium]